MDQRLHGHRDELHAGGNACCQSGFICVNHSVGQTAGARHDRQSTIAHAVKLREAAGLEPGRDQDCVAAALHQMRQGLVIADDHADRSRMPVGCGNEACLKVFVAAPQHCKARTACDEGRHRIEQQI